jgi:flagellar biosynthetic protein FliP
MKPVAQKIIFTGLPMIVLLLLVSGTAHAEGGLEALSVTTGEDGRQTYSVTLQILFVMTLLTLLPAALMMMTSFTRIIIVLAILRTAIGTNTTPTNQILIGMALFLTLFIMAPVFEQSYSDAIKPYMNDQIGSEEALQKASAPFRRFMLDQTRDSDLLLFTNMSGSEGFESRDDVPFSVLMPSFVTSELKTAFQMGFLLFIPFLIIDLVVASVLMSMGMMMLSPLIVSLPFKIMLFVLIDGWSLIIGTLASSFYV